MPLLRALGKCCIALFCLWHMWAVLAYSVYNTEEYPLLHWIEEHREHVRPYMLATSQWQRWNLFSPDPLRRVIEMDIQLETPDGWESVHTINENNTSWFSRAPELKTMRRMEDEDKHGLREHYVFDYCRRTKLAHGTSIRLVKYWFVIPKHEKTESADWWNTWEPEWHEHVMLTTYCPE